MILALRINSTQNKPMKKLDFEKISLDELWALHEQISRVLSSRIVAEKEHLEKRLIQLHRGENPKIAAPVRSKSPEAKRDRPRRKYPKVYLNTETRSTRPKHGRDAASNRDGWCRR